MAMNYLPLVTLLNPKFGMPPSAAQNIASGKSESAAVVKRYKVIVLVGFGVSTLFVSNFKLLAEWFNSRQFVVMGGIFIAVGGIGALVSGVPLAWASSSIGWR